MKSSLVLVAIAVVVAVGIVWAFGIGGAKTTTVIDPNTGKEVKVGALTGPDIPSPYLQWGGVRSWQGRMTLTQATTTVCAIQSPASTSTLQNFSVKVDFASSTATVWDIAKASTAFATTTAIGSAYGIVASSGGFINASTSPAAGAATVFGPSQYVVVGVRHAVVGAGTLFVPTGTCQATWTEHY